MLVISRFYGITIRVNPREHLPPHFHVEYAGDNAEPTLHREPLHFETVHLATRSYK